jgi:single-strand DNA-binding protein
MGSRASLNKVMLIGNLTRDPEMRYTPSGAAVCTFGIATNRYYVASDGQKKEETEFIKIVSWNKLAELCSQLLVKGRKVYVEGRLQTRSWETPDGVSKQTTEVVIDDMRILDAKKDFEGSGDEDTLIHEEPVVAVKAGSDSQTSDEIKNKAKEEDTKKPNKEEKGKDDKDDVDLEDLPF